MVAMVAAQALLVSHCSEHCLTPGLFKQDEAVLEEVFLTKLIEGKHPWRPELDVSRKDRFRSIDQEERGLPSRFGGVGADKLEDRLEVV
jgi:hypothetical protein